MASCCARSERILEIAIVSLWCVAIISSCAGVGIDLSEYRTSGCNVPSVWVLIMRMLVLALCTVNSGNCSRILVCEGERLMVHFAYVGYIVLFREHGHSSFFHGVSAVFV